MKKGWVLFWSVLAGAEANNHSIYSGHLFMKNKEELFHESQLTAKLSTIINNLAGMAYRCLNDRNWTMEWISGGCYNLTLYQPEDLIQNRVTSYNDLIHPDDRDRVWDDIQEALTEKKGFEFEYRIRTAEGQEKWVWEQGHGVFDIHKGLLALEGIISDITQRKELEKELQISETKYRRIFEGSQAMIFLASREGQLLEVNQAGVDLLKYRSRQEILSLPSIEDMFHTKIHWKVFQKQLEKNGFIKEFEAQFKKFDGARAHCLLSGNLLIDEDGSILGYEGIAKDITARVDATRNQLQRNKELEFLNSIALVINRTQDLNDILVMALKNILNVFQIDSGGIFLVNHEKSEFELLVQQGLDINEKILSVPFVLRDHGLSEAMLKSNVVFTPEATFPPFRGFIADKDQRNTRELTCFLITAQDKALGFIALEKTMESIAHQELRLLGSLSNFLGGAIQKAQLWETVRKDREELKKLTAMLFQSQEKERKRIAEELHDEAGQGLTGIKFQLETLEKELPASSRQARKLLFEVKEQIATTYEGMRVLSHGLHPSILSDLGLEPALRSHLEHVSAHCDLKIDFKMIGFTDRIDSNIETVLYRCAQEALTNVLRHAKATRFRLSIIKSFPHIIFKAEDNGIGFDIDLVEKNNKRQNLGLLSMRERVAMLGGSFSLRTSPGGGTLVSIKIQVPEKAYD